MSAVLQGNRVRRSHEVWFHFTKEPRYFAAVDEVREPQSEFRDSSNGGARDFHTTEQSRKWNPSVNDYNPLGKLPGSVWNLTYWECVDRIERGWAPKDNPVILLNPPEDECPPLVRTP